MPSVCRPAVALGRARRLGERATARFERVELADQSHDLARLRVMRLGLDKLPPHVRPAVRELKGGGARRRVLIAERRVDRVAVGDEPALIVAQHRGRRGDAARAGDPVTDRVRRGERPRVPLARPGLAQQRPARLVGAEDRRGEDGRMERVVRRREMVGERRELIPERLRVDREAGARHLLHLPRERQVIGVLRERHADGEGDRVAPAGRELRRAERRLDAPAAAAAVLLPPMADEAEGALDDVDLLGVLGLAVPDGERAAALQALLIGGVEGVDDLDERQRRLRARAVPARRGARRVGHAGPVRRAPLRARAEERAGLRRELLLQELELELEAGRGDLAAGGRERRGQLGEALVQAGELGVLQERHLAQALDVGLVLDLHHGSVMAEM